ncbi:MAG TPA: DUF72 domain-containing protein [Candidatus Limnocylindria bacterium]|nr:DUF72 domain-containing protein [Candidatus Limnocylindria bacterium]
MPAARSGPRTSTVTVGTCGFSYRDWVGRVYPPATKAAEMLELYAQRFAIVEIDATYYRILPASTFASMARRTPHTFRFTAKLPGSATHVRAEAHTLRGDLDAFRRALDPLVVAERFAAALMQFPNSFRPTEAARDHLALLRSALPDIELAAEFRHREWQTNETLELLRDLRIALVNVDEPQFASLPRPGSDVTSNLAYVRFHGRNYQQWWKGDNVTRYDYEYRPEELAPWVRRIVDMAANQEVREVLAFFNNHARGQAVRSAELFEALLSEQLPPGAVVHPAAQGAQAPLPGYEQSGGAPDDGGSS